LIDWCAGHGISRLNASAFGCRFWAHFSCTSALRVEAVYMAQEARRTWAGGLMRLLAREHFRLGIVLTIGLSLLVLRVWEHRNSDQYHCDNSVSAMPGRRSANAVAGVDEPCHGGNGSDCDHTVSAAQIMLLIDRYLGGHFFDTQAGGSAVLDALLLDIRTSGSLRSDHPLLCFHVGSFPVFSRKPIFDTGDGCCHGVHRVR